MFCRSQCVSCFEELLLDSLVTYIFFFQIVKKNVIENLVPVVISAKHLFEQKHSPLLRDMLCYLKELMQVQATTPTHHSQAWGF